MMVVPLFGSSYPPLSCYQKPDPISILRHAGWSTNFQNAVVDTLGNPLDFILTGGQAQVSKKLHVFCAVRCCFDMVYAEMSTEA